jgi:CheY-like chemotaxis protein
MVSSRITLLYVDDDPNDLALLGHAIDLTDSDLWLLTSHDGRHAMDYLEGRGIFCDRTLHPFPDLILLDLHMRFVTGIEFLAWRRTSPGFSCLPVLVFTGSVDQTEISRAIRMGADGYLTKPQTFKGWKGVVDQIQDFAALNPRSQSSPAVYGGGGLNKALSGAAH